MHFNNEYHVVPNQPALPDNPAPQQNANQAAPPAGNGEFREGGRVVIQPYIRPERFTLRVRVASHLLIDGRCLFVYICLFFVCLFIASTSMIKLAKIVFL